MLQVNGKISFEIFIQSSSQSQSQSEMEMYSEKWFLFELIITGGDSGLFSTVLVFLQVYVIDNSISFREHTDSESRENMGEFLPSAYGVDCATQTNPEP